MLAIPTIDGLTPVYFVVLKLRNAAGKIVSRNFYWLSAKEAADYRPLADLPPVKLKASSNVDRSGDESVVRVRVENPTDRVAFFIHLALHVTKTPRKSCPSSGTTITSAWRQARRAN